MFDRAIKKLYFWWNTDMNYDTITLIILLYTNGYLFWYYVLSVACLQSIVCFRHWLVLSAMYFHRVVPHGT